MRVVPLAGRVGLSLIPRDKVVHAAGSLVVASFCAAVGYALLRAGMKPLSVVVAVGGTAAALSVEGTQWFDNRASRTAGEQPRHEVSMLDALASSIPAWVVAFALGAL